MSERKNLLPIVNLILVISIIINALLSLVSFLWHYYLHVDINSPIFNPEIPIGLLITTLVINGLDIAFFVSIRRNPTLSYLLNLGLVSIGFVFMIVLPLSQFYDLPTADFLPLSMLLIVDWLNSVSAWRIALVMEKPKQKKPTRKKGK